MQTWTCGWRVDELLDYWILWIFSNKLQGILSNSIDTLWHSMKLYRYFREPHGIPWNSTIFPGIPWTSKETPWHFMAFHRTASLLHGTPWNSMAFHKTPWILHGSSVEFHGFPWNSMDVHRFPWISMEFHEVFRTGKYELLKCQMLLNGHL